jgi:hypothetical protein
MISSPLHPAKPARLPPGPRRLRPDERGHAEIAVQIARLGRLIDDIGDRDPGAGDTAGLRDILYGPHAILRLHTLQEDEAYLSLGGTADAGRTA